MKYILIVPTIARDVNKFIINIDTYFRFLPIYKVCIIGGAGVQELLPNDKRISYIDEADLVDYEAVKNAIISRTGNSAAVKRAGWYVQQFIKMKYSTICPDEYYLLWDSDTVPLKSISMFREKHPLFDCKHEYNKAYFETISAILPGMRKCINKSFIAEHMIIKTAVMMELIGDIEKNVQISGRGFCEKIINSVPVQYLPLSGFSEFETYGTYAYTKHHNLYQLRRWRSMRSGGFFYECGNGLTDKRIKWLAANYEAITFEKFDSITRAGRIVQSNWYMKFFSSASLNAIALFIRTRRKLNTHIQMHR